MQRKDLRAEKRLGITGMGKFLMGRDLCFCPCQPYSHLPILRAQFELHLCFLQFLVLYPSAFP